MVQSTLPLFPVGTTEISKSIAFSNQAGKISYFHYAIPTYVHDESDIASFRLITSMLYVNGLVTQVEIQKAFGVTAISVKRSVKTYREEGAKGFFVSKQPNVKPRKLLPKVLEEIQELLNQGVELQEISEKHNVKVNTLLKAITEGRLTKKKKLRRA